MASWVVLAAVLVASTTVATADPGIDLPISQEADIAKNHGYQMICLNDEFKCRDELLCVKYNTVCDGVPDCRDRSDEEACARDQKCEDHLFKCVGDDPLKCINPHWVCDDRKDCKDGSDEKNCTKDRVGHLPIASASGTFGDRSPQSAQSSCNQTTEFKCDDGLCIPADNICDDISDCMDGSDENREMCSKRPCTEEQFTCLEDKVCIPIRWRCDGNPDCNDGSDEFKCGSEGSEDAVVAIECGSQMFDCGVPSNSTDRCIALTKVCDGSEECPDGRDESSGNCTASCKDHHCGSTCQMMPDGSEGICTCPPGYQLNSDGLSCDDIDECSEFGKCSQVCVNRVGSYECSCTEGYYMSSDMTCKASGNVDAILFFSGKSEIRGLNLRTKNDFVVTKDQNWTNTAIGIAYDARDDRVFWTATKNSKSRIISSSRKGERIEEVVSDLVMPESLAVDYVARNIYFSEPAKDYLGVCNLDAVNGSRWCAELHYQGVRQPREIALYIPRGLLFFTDWAHQMAKIVRVGMDGTHPTTIVSSDLIWPNGITVDAVAKRIYWSDAKHDLLESSGFDGDDRRQTEVNVIRHPFSLAVFEDRLFWSDWDMKKIQSCHKVTGMEREYLFNDTKIEPFGIHVYHPALEPVLDNPCKNRPCSHLCLMAHGGSTFTCKCPTGFVLGIDERSCVILLKGGQVDARFLPTTSTPENTTTTTLMEPRIAPTMSRDMQQQRLKIGLAVGFVLSLILFGFLVACYYSYRRGGSKTRIPVLRYHKNQPFSAYPGRGGRLDDKDGIVSTSEDPSASERAKELSGKLEPANDATDEGDRTGKGFKPWKPNRTSNPYYKL